MSGDSEAKRLCGMCQRMHDAADPKDGRPPDEQLEDLLGYMDVLEEAIDRAGVGDEARARDKPRAVDEAIDILFEQREDLTTDLAAARGANLVLDERVRRERERAGKLAEALARIKKDGPVERYGANVPQRLVQWILTVREEAGNALAEHRKGME